MYHREAITECCVDFGMIAQLIFILVIFSMLLLRIDQCFITQEILSNILKALKKDTKKASDTPKNSSGSKPKKSMVKTKERLHN